MKTVYIARNFVASENVEKRNVFQNTRELHRPSRIFIEKKGSLVEDC